MRRERKKVLVVSVFAVTALITALYAPISPVWGAEKTAVSRVSLVIDSNVGIVYDGGYASAVPEGDGAGLYEVTNVEVTNEEEDGFGVYAPPELQITLETTDENTYFSNTASSAFRLKLSEESKTRYEAVRFVRAKRENQKQTMELTVRLLFLEDVDYEGVASPYSAYWDPKQPGKARWSQVPKAKYYQIQLIRDHRAVGGQYSIYGDGYDFSSLITEDGEYWFQVRSVRKSTNEKSDWTKSEKLKVTGEPKQEEAAPGPGEEDAALPESAGSWQQAADGIRWWWRNPNGSFPAGEWMKINGEWYYFDEEGYWEMEEAGQS